MAAPTLPQLAWFAGIVDGEGSISISQRPDIRGTAKRYTCKLAISMTHKPTIEKITQLIGGAFYRHISTNLKWADSYRWQITDSKLLPVLKMIIPYLITKKEQCKYCIEFLERKTIWSKMRWVHPSEVIFRECFYAIMRYLNQKGGMKFQPQR